MLVKAEREGKRMRIISVFHVIILISVLVGCGLGNNSAQDSNLALIKTTNPTPALLDNNTNKKLNLVNRIKEDAYSIKEIYDVAVIKGHKETLVAYKVKHLYRFQMKIIEKRLNEKLEKKYPDEDFIVSSDYKIFLEAVKLNEKMKDPKFSNEKANNKLDEIIKLKKEMT